jgi:hypothetical protein
VGWVKRMMRLGQRHEPEVDPLAVALDATVADLRRVASEVRDTNKALTRRVESLKGVPKRE